VTTPPLLLADEPTGNLDSAKAREIMELLARLNRERGIAIVLVTHDAALARWASRIVQFFDGRIVAPGAEAA
jgi:putative ABC transport system ATP-binding protein